MEVIIKRKVLFDNEDKEKIRAFLKDKGLSIGRFMRENDLCECYLNDLINEKIDGSYLLSLLEKEGYTA